MLRLILLLALAAPAAAQDTAWIEAVRDNRLASIRTLLPEMADVDLATPRGKTALMAAAGRGDAGLTAALLEAGAAVDAANKLGGTALIHAALAGDPATLALLLNRGARPDRQAANGWSALMMAAAKGRTAALDLLIARGADPDLADVFGWTPLMRAIDNRHFDAARRLLDHPKVDVERANHRGQTALHLAVIGGPRDLVRRLLDRGASPDTADAQGRTPRRIAGALGRGDWLRVMP